VETQVLIEKQQPLISARALNSEFP
jgi:hypothetical protein